MEKEKGLQDSPVEKRTIVLSADKTISDQFTEYLDRYGDSVSNIIIYLFILNDRVAKVMQPEPHLIPTEMEDEILEFYDYFMQNFHEKTYDSRMRVWRGQEPLILKVAKTIMDIRLYWKQKSEFRYVDPEIMREARSLTEQIWGIRADRQVQVCINAEENKEPLMDTLLIRYPIAQRFWEIPKTALLYDCVAMLLTDGALAVRVMRDRNVEIFGVHTDLNGHWVPLSAQDMLTVHTTCPDGRRIDPEDGVQYTEIHRGRIPS